MYRSRAATSAASVADTDPRIRVRRRRGFA
jgi:hypothetical protein